MKLGASNFISFTESIEGIHLPERFTFPFYYTPHELCKKAAEQLQRHLKTQTDWKHNFGLIPKQEGMVIGKMFGVLVVENQKGELGFLAGFSGKLAGENHHPFFVPPVFDILQKDGFFVTEEKNLNRINSEIELLEGSVAFAEATDKIEEAKNKSELELANHRVLIKQGKLERKARRVEARRTLSQEDYDKLEKELVSLSLDQQYQYKRLVKHWREVTQSAQSRYNELKSQIESQKEERKNRSGALQNRLFHQYQFLNANGNWKSLLNIFEHTDQGTPPAGAGECAAPKLLHYAFSNELKPIAMAEFWWGASPKSEVRKHGQYYPACRGKCEPILGHMLEGLKVDSNPMLQNPALGKELEIIFEDEYLLAVNKPAEFLSVPGKTIDDSVYSRMKTYLPNATGPLIVHRLDMSTSGILLLAKTKEIHKNLQRQFLKRSIQKRYVALLEGHIHNDEGEIELPLRVDLDNRPCQLVCYDHGKLAKTKWEKVGFSGERTRIHFFPITGRTHQLRVHAAHHLGLNAPIVGDDLYGTLDNRLHLHAEELKFDHPITRKRVRLVAKAPF